MSRILFVITVACTLAGIARWYQSLAGTWLYFAGAAIAAGLQWWLVRYLGDAARYLSPMPGNIALRQRIREDGLRILRELHESRDYDRIIVVGHSLGSVIAYDLLTFLWQSYHDRHDAPHRMNQPEIRGISKVGESLSLTRDADPDLCDFERRKQERELPTCPPAIDGKTYFFWRRPPYSAGGQMISVGILNHAAAFAVTRWTNLYFPVAWGFFGDLVGGRLRPVLGLGIKDVPVSTSKWRGRAGRTLASHVLYWWKDPQRDAQPMAKDDSLGALRSALGLERLAEYGRDAAKRSRADEAGDLGEAPDTP